MSVRSLKVGADYILSFKKHMANRHIFLVKWHVPASAVTNLVQYFGNFFRTMNNGILIFVPAILMTSSRRAAIATSQYLGWHFFLYLQDAASGRKKRRGGIEKSSLADLITGSPRTETWWKDVLLIFWLSWNVFKNFLMRH